jgi:hypothetical protein
MDLGEHASEEVIEQYSTGTLPASEVELFEKHLRVCQVCQDRLRRTDEFMAPLCAALRTIAQGASLQEKPRMDEAAIDTTLREYFHVQNQLVELRSQTRWVADCFNRVAQALRGPLPPEIYDQVGELPTHSEIRDLVSSLQHLTEQEHELRHTLEEAGVFSKAGQSQE